MQEISVVVPLLGQGLLLPNPFEFIILQLTKSSTLYNVDTGSAVKNLRRKLVNYASHTKFHRNMTNEVWWLLKLDLADICRHFTYLFWAQTLFYIDHILDQL
jgi:hypothetical protein